MAAPKGNEYYLLRSTSGRDKIYKTPKALAEACNEYFKWCEENPLIEIDFRGKDAQRVELPKMRAYTMEGLCSFLDITSKTFRNYEERKDFLPITTRVRDIMRKQKLEGAAAGFLNPSIIARELGLTDKKEIDQTIRELNVNVKIVGEDE